MWRKILLSRLCTSSAGHMHSECPAYTSDSFVVGPMRAHLNKRHLMAIDATLSRTLFARRHQQVKEEGWWLVVADAGGDELLALKRLSFSERATTQLAFPEAAFDGTARDAIILHLVR